MNWALMGAEATGGPGMAPWPVGPYARSMLPPVPADIEVVLFDFGGVLLTSPFDAFAAYEAEVDLPPGTCLLSTSAAAAEAIGVNLCGRRILKTQP